MASSAIDSEDVTGSLMSIFFRAASNLRFLIDDPMPLLVFTDSLMPRMPGLLLSFVLAFSSMEATAHDLFGLSALELLI